MSAEEWVEVHLDQLEAIAKGEQKRGMLVADTIGGNVWFESLESIDVNDPAFAIVNDYDTQVEFVVKCVGLGGVPLRAFRIRNGWLQ